MYFFRCIIMMIFFGVVFNSNVNAQFGDLKKKVPTAPKKEKKKAAYPDVDDVLNRVKITKENFQGSTKCISKSRDVLFDIAATDEKKEQLKSKESELSDAKTDDERTRINTEIDKLKDDEINRAQQSGELENKKLDEQQTKNTGKIIGYIGLAIIKDKEAIDNGPKIIDDGKKAVEGAKSDPMMAAKMGGKINELSTAVTKDIPAITKEAPHQIKTLEAFLGATSSLKKNNPVKEEKAPDTFNDMDKNLDW